MEYSKPMFTVEMVRQINQSLMDGSYRDREGLSPASQRILADLHFTREDINRAFAEAWRRCNQH
jgi:hypothetical protein